MKRLERYIGLHLLQGFLLVLLGLLSMDGFLALANELGDVQPGVYGVQDALVYVALTLPRRIYEYLPMAAFAGALLGVGGLAAHSELVVMRAAGFPRWKIARAMLYAGILLAFLMILVGEGVMPWAEQSARDLKFALKSRTGTETAGDVIWLRDRNRFMRVFRVQSPAGPLLLDVLLFHLDENGQPVQRLEARRMKVHQSPWVLEDVQQMDFLPRRVVRDQRPSLSIEPLADQRLLEMGVIKPRFLSMADTAAIIRHLQRRQMDSRSYQVAWWVHLINPLSLLALVFAAGNFLHGSQRGGTAGRRLLLGVMLGLAFYVFNRTFANFAQIYEVPIPWVVALPTLLVAGYSLWRYRKRV